MKLSKQKFSQYIEERSMKENSSCIETIINYCEETNFEIEMIKTLVNSSLKKKIEEEAKSLRMLPGKSAKLPL